jgi:uncharacterized protein (DUF486 family)
MEPLDPLEQSTGRSIRLAIVAFGLLALLGVVAFASRSGFSGSSNAKPTPGYVSYAFTAFLIVFVLMIPIAAYTLVMQAREGEVARKSFKSRVIQNFITVTIFGFIAFAVLYLKRHKGQLFNLNGNALKNLSAQKAVHHGGKPGAFEPTFEWPVLAAAAAVLAIAVFFAYRSYRARKLRKVVVLEPTVAQDFAATIGDVIGELEAEPDPRRAVIAAYARMEGVLGRHGLKRKPSETPVEYLGRILGGLTSRSDAVARLTRLFELAKFSRHDIDDSMKRDAIESLRAIRADLQEDRLEDGRA